MKKVLVFVCFIICCSQLAALEWSSKSSQSMPWGEAMDYCKKLNESGHNDWRLPTIDELRTLITNCPVAQSGGQCGNLTKKTKITDNMVKNEAALWHYPRLKCGCGEEYGTHYSKLGDNEVLLWSSSTSTVEEGGQFFDIAWSVAFSREGTVIRPYSLSKKKIYETHQGFSKF